MKTAISIIIILIFSLKIPNIHAQTDAAIPNTMKSTLPSPSTGSNLPLNNTTNTIITPTDTIRTQQSSTTKNNCINSANQGSLCGPNANNWCATHANATECMNFNSNPTTPPTIKP
jgi:hypothetical protein